MNESPGNYVESIQPISKGHKPYDSIFIAFSEIQNYGNGEHISGYPGLGRKEEAEVGVAIKATKGIFVLLELSISRLHQFSES